jgi:hypothetical protein
MHFDPLKLIRVETDASGCTYTGILSQPIKWLVIDKQKAVWHPIAFHSKKLDPAELNYRTPDQELLVIVRYFLY